MTARVSILLKSRASLTCFRVGFLPGRAKDLSVPRYNSASSLKSMRKKDTDKKYGETSVNTVSRLQSGLPGDRDSSLSSGKGLSLLPNTQNC